MKALSVGVALAVVMAVIARITRFDIDCSYHATVLIVIANNHVLFAFIAKEAILPELFGALLFSSIAALGVYSWTPLIGIGILLHGAFDLIHSHLIQNPGVPPWWPAFCGGVDIVLGSWVIYLTQTGKEPSSHSHIPNQDHSLFKGSQKD